MLNRIQSTYREYPKPFWVITGTTFVDRLGGTLIFPFFSLCITQKIGVGMTDGDDGPGYHPVHDRFHDLRARFDIRNIPDCDARGNFWRDDRSSVSQALAARFAPEDMGGRYMAFFGFAWMVPSIFGHAAAGIIMDNYDPRWVWYLGGILSALAFSGFLILHAKTQKRFPPKLEEKLLAVVEST